MREAERLIRPLEEIFDKVTVQNLKNLGVKGLIPLELSIEELMDIAEKRGYETHEVDLLSKAEVGMYWISPEEDSLTFLTKNGPDGKSVYILNDDLGRFKAIYIGA
ncbi:hypothetical protein HYW39_01175, partial [Candidatus Curtissbacteria bacterium]|nr:hypothetical protein [Candidatus Curtissbacteria bacterium]MBI2594289.1 hypothetical protein [Candidatus Curtissbacteria bacterium]